MLPWIIGGLIALGFRLITPKSRNRYGLIAFGDKTEVASRRYLLYFLLPLWLVPGFLDYIWHRRTHIETTAGTRESVCHSLMMAEAGIPITLALLFEVNAGMFLLMIAAFLAHTATTWCDVSYTVNKRDIGPAEQHTHSFLEVLPLCNLSFAICLHWDQFAALFGAGGEKARFRLRWRKPMLPPAYIGGLLGAVALVIGIPYTEELLRCLRAERLGLIGAETPPWLRERARLEPSAH